MATPAPAAAAAAAAPAAAAAAPAAAAAGMPFPYEVLVTSGCPTACGRFKRGQDINRRASFYFDSTVNNVPTRYTIKFDRSWVLVQTSTPAAGQPAAAAPQELYVNTTPTDALPLAGWVVRGGAAPAPTMELVIVEAGSAASLLHPDLVATLWSLNVAGECEAAFEALNIKTHEQLSQHQTKDLTVLGVTFETARRVLNCVAAPANEPFQVVPIFKGIGEIGKNLCFKLQITNLSHTPTSTTLVLRVDATAYWRQSRQPLPTIEPWKSATVDVVLVALPGAGIENLPEGFTVRLMEGENQVYQTPGLFHMKDLLAGLTAGLQPPRDSELYNIYMVGNPGAGKSSFVSHFLTLCSSGNNVLMNALAFGGGAGHCTKRITKYQTNVAFLTAAIDVPGTSKDIFTQDFTQRLLDGELPFNWSITENSLSKDMALLVKMQPSRLKRAAHSVVFFVPASALDDLHFLEDMTRILNIVREKGFNPIIMLSLVDTIDGEADIRYHPMQPGPKLKALMAKATRTFHVPPAQVLYCINYTSEQTRSFELDALCYKNWEVILHSAESFNHRPSIELSES